MMMLSILCKQVDITIVFIRLIVIKQNVQKVHRCLLLLLQCCKQSKNDILLLIPDFRGKSLLSSTFRKPITNLGNPFTDCSFVSQKRMMCGYGGIGEIACWHCH